MSWPDLAPAHRRAVDGLLTSAAAGLAALTEGPPAPFLDALVALAIGAPGQLRAL